MDKAPAFQFYARDWVSDERVRTMSWEAKGVYIDMLAHQWLEGSLPDFGPTLARLLGLDSRKLARIRVELSANFSGADDEGRIRNLKLDAQRKQDVKWREGQANHGRKGAEKRWGAHDNPNGVAIENGWGKDSSSSASATTTENLVQKAAPKPQSWNFKMKAAWQEFSPFLPAPTSLFIRHRKDHGDDLPLAALQHLATKAAEDPNDRPYSAKDYYAATVARMAANGQQPQSKAQRTLAELDRRREEAARAQSE